MPLILDSASWERAGLIAILERQNAQITGLAKGLHDGKIPLPAGTNAAELHAFLSAVSELGASALQDPSTPPEILARVVNVEYEAVNMLMAVAPPPPLASIAPKVKVPVRA
jgi:hypothetical protein